MSSTDRVIRIRPGAQLLRPIWPESQFEDGSTTPNEHCEAIGFVATSFNGLELYFKILVGMIAKLGHKHADALLTHMGNVALGAALRSICSDILDDQDVRDEMLYCADFFDRCRINRNFIIHNATYRPIGFAGQDYSLMTSRSARGKLRIRHWALPLASIRKAAEINVDGEEYIAHVIGPCVHSSSDEQLKLPFRPPMPENLAESKAIDDMSSFLYGQINDEESSV